LVRATAALAVASALACARGASSGGACADAIAAWQALPADARPTHLFALSPTAAWVLGPKVFLDWDGCTWRARSAPPGGEGGGRAPQGLWASGPRDVWTVMSEPFAYRSNPRDEEKQVLVRPARPAQLWRWNGDT
jgi:hypothetical protein